MLCRVFFLILSITIFLNDAKAQELVKAYGNFANYNTWRCDTIGHISVKGFKDGWGNVVEGACKITTIDKKQNQFISERYWLLETDNATYINNFMFMGVKGYSRVSFRSDKYLFFSAPLGTNLNILYIDTLYADVLPNYPDSGKPKMNSQSRFYHIVDVKSGRLWIACKKVMLIILQDYPILKEQYLHEPEPEMKATYIHYLSKIASN